MNRRDWIGYLIPKDEHTEPLFKEQMDRLSVKGLRVIAAAMFAAPLVSRVTDLAFTPDLGIEIPLTLLPLGLVAFTLSFLPLLVPQARSAGLLVGFVMAVMPLWTSRGMGVPFIAAGYILPGILTAVMLLVMIALPVKPLQILGLGVTIGTVYWGWSLLPFPSAVPGSHAPPIVVYLVLLCAALTAVVYRQRIATYRARRDADETLEELRRAQVRICVSDNDASHGRFAAALSHELNSPLGSLVSAFETMIRVRDREEGNPAKLEAVFEQAVRSGRQSVTRLRETVERMRQLTDLERSEERLVDLNELWSETVALLNAELSTGAEVKLDLRALPPFKCRPKLISVVFGNLLRNAAAAIDRKGTIVVSSERRNGDIVMEVRDDGRGISADELSNIFDPAFRVARGRVSTTNWGLFVARSIITEHGGHIEMDSKEQQGTTVRLVLHPTESGRRECSGCTAS